MVGDSAWREGGRSNVPLLDLRAQFHGIRRPLLSAVERVLSSGQYILGEEVRAFEEEMARFLQIPHAIGVASGTDALWLALKALGVGPGDRVLTTPFTFVATAEAVSLLGAHPVFVDVDPQTLNLSSQAVEDYLRSDPEASQIKAAIVVHLYGKACDMQSLTPLFRSAGIPVVEDAAQALGAYAVLADGRRRPVGTCGAAGCLSFFPTKNLGACGDGGMVVTSRPELAERIRSLRVHGSPERYRHMEIGINSRLDELQAAILRVKLPLLPTWNRARRERARTYHRLFQEVGLEQDGLQLPPLEDPSPDEEVSSHVFHQYVIRVPNRRDELRKFLQERGVATEVYYPIPLHLQTCFKDLGYRPGDFPESERAAREVLALPLYPEMTALQQERVVRVIQDFFRRNG